MLSTAADQDCRGYEGGADRGPAQAPLRPGLRHHPVHHHPDHHLALDQLHPAGAVAATPEPAPAVL